MQKPTTKEISRHWLTGCIIKLGHAPPTWTMELITNHWPPKSDSRHDYLQEVSPLPPSAYEHRKHKSILDVTELETLSDTRC